MKQKKKVVLLPLDERPCNFNFPGLLFHFDKMEIIQPTELGDKKVPADLQKIEDFVRQECMDADYAVLSIDTLLYGGLIPSRLHSCKEEDAIKRLDLLRTMKRENPSLILYAFACIMRCPRYSSSDEEPDYYAYCGEQLHKLGACIHKQKLGTDTTEEQGALRNQIPDKDLADYTKRREFNLAMNLKTAELVEEGVIDFLIIPQDDSAEFGYTAMDQIAVREFIAAHTLQNRIYIYPGADEVALTLLSRVANHMAEKTPKVYVKYASIHAPFSIPPYEDRSLGETVKSHLMAAGCLQTDSVTEADFILGLTAPARNMQEAVCQPVTTLDYAVERNLTEFVYAVKQYIAEGKVVTIGDNSYVNGGDLELMDMLEQDRLLFKLAGYAGWNTSANTIGTAIAQGVLYLYRGSCREALDFLALRYLEDAGYCGHIRKVVTEEELPFLSMNYFDVREKDGVVSEIVKKRLLAFMQERYPSLAKHLELKAVHMPWRRMFEVELEAAYK